MLGSLYGDASGNGPANGAAWDPSITSWRLRAGEREHGRPLRAVRTLDGRRTTSEATRGRTVARRNNSVTLTDFWPAGQGVPFPHGQMTDVVTHASPLGKRAFIMSVIEGEGEVCDPSNATCATAQIADNSRTISGGTNPQYHEHIVALLQPAIDAGLTSTFTATGKGCVPQTVDQLGRGPPGRAVHPQQRLRGHQGLAGGHLQPRAGLRVTSLAMPAVSPTPLHLHHRHHPHAGGARSTRPRSPSARPAP